MNARHWVRAHSQVCGAALALVLACAVLGVALAGSSSAQRRAAQHESRVQRMEDLARQIAAARGNAAAILIAPPGTLTTEKVHLAAQRLKVSLTQTQGLTHPRDAQTVEQIVTLAAGAVTREALGQFLAACEDLNPAVRTTELRMSINLKSPALVDATAKLSAYERKMPSN